MWQSQMENKHFSIAYFNCITSFKVVKGRAYTHCVDVSICETSTRGVQAPPLNGSSEIQHFESSDAIDRIMFVFYMGLGERNL